MGELRRMPEESQLHLGAHPLQIVYPTPKIGLQRDNSCSVHLKTHKMQALVAPESSKANWMRFSNSWTRRVLAA